MAIYLEVVANPTAASAVLTNTEYSYDQTNIAANSVVHTGGKDGNYIRIPDCSGSEYYKEHHILIKNSSWAVALWNNDDKDHTLYWSTGDFYSEEHPIAGSGTYDTCSILIQGSGNNITVSAFPF
jgi:hypothetical protein